MSTLVSFNNDFITAMLLHVIRLLTAISLICLTAQNGVSQTLPDSSIRKIDGFFKKWNNANTPGCVIGIVRNDSLIYTKGYGLANMEDSTLNTPLSIYYMCSVSKQFTGYAITLLTRQGRVKLDNDIREYLPWVKFPGKITVRNLLNHTSGIRDDIGLAAISGLAIEGMLTQDVALNILKKQRSLNFNPGEKYSYSNSNYVLLAEIVKCVSGQSFRAFTDSAIFKPLNMADTRFVDNPEEMIKGRAASYEFVIDEKSSPKYFFENRYQNVYTLGDGGLFTNVINFSHWVMNFYMPRAGDLKDIEQLTEKGKLNNGKEISYALGIAVDSNRGWKRYIHNGSLAGYRTVVTIFPDLKTGFIIFGNAGDSEVYGKIDELAGMFIPNIEKTKPITRRMSRDSSLTVLGDTSKVKPFLGNYIAEDGFHVNVSLKNGRLYFNNSMLLVPELRDTFSLLQNSAVRYAFSHDKATGQVSADLITPASPEAPIHLVKAGSVSANELKNYVGTYYCAELECSYEIILRGQELYFISNKHNDARLTLMGNDHLLTEHSFIDHLLIKRDAKNRIRGFELNSKRIMHLYFDKVN